MRLPIKLKRYAANVPIPPQSPVNIQARGQANANQYTGSKNIPMDTLNVLVKQGSLTRC